MRNLDHRIGEKGISMAYIKLDRGIWVLIADGEKALFLKNKGDVTYPDLTLVCEMHEENPETREQGTDRPGRYRDATGAHKSGFEETDWHRIGKERFATEIAERLSMLAQRDRFQKIILVAPPLVLGELRKHFAKDVLDRIAAEVPKTLTNHPVAEIEKILQAS